MPGGADTAEYETVLNCTEAIKTAIQNNLVDIADRAVAKHLIIPENGGKLRNSNNDKSDRASLFVELLQSKVKENKQNYWIFFNDVLGGNHYFYHDIIDHLKSEYDRIRDKKMIKAKPPTANSSSTGEGRIQADSTDVVDPPKETDDSETPLYDESEAEINIDPVPCGSKFEQLQSFAKDVKLVLHTVNDKEITAVLSKLQPPDIDGFEKPISFDAIPFKIVFGTLGGYRVAQVNTEMGTECEKDLKEALTRLPNARAVIAVGVAYGSDREKHKFGDVLVSKYMHSVKNIRLQPDEIISRPTNLSTVQVADYLSGIFTKGTITWNKKFQCNKTTDSDSKPRYAKVHCGSIISAPMLVADAKSRDKLLRNYPSGAIGGEMEGGVLLEIQNKHNADRARHHDLGVIIIKGVGDFGDDQKQEGKKWQYTASLAAASYIEHKLNMTGGRLFTETEPENPED